MREDVKEISTVKLADCYDAGFHDGVFHAVMVILVSLSLALLVARLYGTE